MKNTIEARIEFSFKGEEYTPTATVDLDAMMENGGELSDLYSFLARQYNIDTYSYLYDAMESHDITFDKPTGLATQCFNNGQFDKKAFELLWFEQHEIAMLADIAKQHMNIDDLEKHGDLKAALIAAFNAGKP